MNIPVSWLKEFVDTGDMSIETIARKLTLAGLEVKEIRYVGWPMPDLEKDRSDFTVSGLTWDPEKIVVGAILEVMPHPNADRLVLCRLDDGQQEHTVLTGAPNLFEFKGKGPLEEPIKVAYAKEGARIFDGHQQGEQVMNLKRAKIRGVESYSMACSEKELGISDEHEGIIVLDDDAPVGVPLADYMGDAVLEIDILPNIARAANIVGVARELAAIIEAELKMPEPELMAEGPKIDKMVSIEIQEPELNPRFVLGLLQDIEIQPSPYKAQLRLTLAGMRPINNIVDATNYAMLELGEPLHAFDYDVLLERTGGKAPTVITRTAEQGEKLTTLDEVERTLDDFTVLVCDTEGSLSIAGVMGGLESEVTDTTRNVLLEGAAWNFINIRRTLKSQRFDSEAAYRFSRGVHPSLAKPGVERGLELMHRWAGGTLAQGLVDAYPLPPEDPTIEITTDDVRRWLGIELTAEEMAGYLDRLDFKTKTKGHTVTATVPPHRLDISSGIVGVADLMEEIARIYGYDKIPETRLSDTLPPQRANPRLEWEERLRDVMVSLGLQEVFTYRMTTPEKEARLWPGRNAPQGVDYITLANPISSDRRVMRRSLMSSLMEVVERNARVNPRLALYEIGPVFLPQKGTSLPQEPNHLVTILSGPRTLPAWQGSDQGEMDFFDLKGIVESMAAALHLGSVVFEPIEDDPRFHPGKCAAVILEGQRLGVMGELHPLVVENYELVPESPLMALDLLIDPLIGTVSARYAIEAVPSFPPVLEDLALVVDENIPAARVEEVLRQACGDLLTELRLFDLYRGEQIGAGKKSLAYALTYQSPDRTLTDEDVASIRQRVIKAIEKELGASLRE
jgi:phenylalanyl-tRNA synthetase beta chain